MVSHLVCSLSSLLDCFTDAQIGPAAADVARHGGIDVGVGRMRVACQQRRSGHDLARLAVAALHHLPVEPGLLDFPAHRGRADRLDCLDFGGANTVDRSDTGTSGDAVNVYSASAAERLAAAELRARHAQQVAQDPEERRVAVHIDAVCGPVDFDSKGHGALSLLLLTASDVPE